MATIYDIARIVGVSTATVSRALNNKGYVREEVRQRIWEVAEELNYVPNSTARSLINKRSQIVSLIIPDISNPFFALVARGVEDVTRHFGYSLLICNTDGSTFREKQYVQIAREKQADGIIFISCQVSNNYLQELTSNLPVVVADRSVEDLSVDMVLNDNVEGSREAVRHLVRLGHQAIATIRGPQETQTGIDRYIGYEKVLKESGLEVVPDYVRDGDFKEQSGYYEAQQLLKLPHPPTAIFAANDLMALGTLNALEQAGVRVPEDMALVGYDDIPIASRIKPGLTTVAQLKYELGQQAAERLMWRLSNPEEKLKPETVVLKPRLIIRESSLVRSIVS